MVVVNHLFRKLFSNLHRGHALIKNFTTQSMSKAWTLQKIAPDLKFEVPRYKLAVQYPELTINEGNTVKPRQAVNPPNITWRVNTRWRETPPDEPKFFAVSFLDLDAPSRSKPKYRAWNHWLVANIPGDKVEEGETMAEYIGPGPPQGTDLHRYVFLLFMYKNKAKFEEKKLVNTTYEGRRNFSITEYAKKYDFGLPVAANFFLSEYDDSVPALHQKIGLKKYKYK